MSALKIFFEPGNPFDLFRNLRNLARQGQLHQVTSDEFQRVFGSIKPSHQKIVIRTLLSKTPCDNVASGLASILNSLSIPDFNELIVQICPHYLPKLFACLSDQDQTALIGRVVNVLADNEKLSELLDHMTYFICLYKASSPKPGWRKWLNKLFPPKDAQTSPAAQIKFAKEQYRKALGTLINALKEQLGEAGVKASISKMKPKYMTLLAGVLTGETGQKGPEPYYVQSKLPNMPLDEHSSDGVGPDVYQEQLAAFGLDNFLKNGEEE